MRSIFTAHAGEVIVGTAIEGSFRELEVWVPAKDSGIDLLVTNKRQEKVASLQVKFSKDYLGANVTRPVSPEIAAIGWWTLKRKKIAESRADVWAMVLYRFLTRKFDFVVIPPKELLARYDSTGRSGDVIQSYLWVTTDGCCLEARGLGKDHEQEVRFEMFEGGPRDFTTYLNVWPWARVD